MNVYKFKVTAGYGGGEVIVAADSKLEAYGVIATKDSFVAQYTSVDTCEELTTLDADVEFPCIISSEYYFE